MSHKHILGQGFNIKYMMEYVYCVECRKKWSKEEITRIIISSEYLSAEDATTIYRVVNFEDDPLLFGKLISYAEALEGS